MPLGVRLESILLKSSPLAGGFDGLRREMPVQGIATLIEPEKLPLPMMSRLSPLRLVLAEFKDRVMLDVTAVEPPTVQIP